MYLKKVTFARFFKKSFSSKSLASEILQVSEAHSALKKSTTFKKLLFCNRNSENQSFPHVFLKFDITMKELLVKWKKTSKEQLFVNYLDLIGHILSYGNFSRIITMMMCFVRWLIYWVILWEIRVGQIQTSDNFYKTCWFPYYQINPMINQRIQRRFSASNLLLQKIHTWIAVQEKC